MLLAREDLSYRRRAAVVLRSAERRILHGSHVRPHSSPRNVSETSAPRWRVLLRMVGT